MSSSGLCAYPSTSMLLVVLEPLSRPTCDRLAGRAFKPLQQLSLKIYALCGRVAVARIKPEERHIFSVETGIQVLQVLQAADEQARADKQKERERDLPDDQRFVQRRPRPSRSSARVFFQRRGEVEPRRAHRRRQPKQRAGQERDRQRKPEHMSIERGIERD